MFNRPKTSQEVILVLEKENILQIPMTMWRADSFFSFTLVFDDQDNKIQSFDFFFLNNNWNENTTIHDSNQWNMFTCWACFSDF